MDLQHIKQVTKEDPPDAASAIVVKSMHPDERFVILAEAIELIDRSVKLFSKLCDPGERRCIGFENWSSLLKIEMEMAQFVRKLRV